MARVPIITQKSDVPAEHHDLVDAIVGSRGGITGPFQVFLHSPDMAARVAHLGTLVRFEGSLDMRVRSLAAIVVAREYEGLYVWGAQVRTGRTRGVPESTITAIKENRSDGIPAEDLLIIDFTRQLLRQHRVDDATANAVLERFGRDQYIQLTGTIGYFSLLCMTVNACEMEPGADMERLKI